MSNMNNIFDFFKYKRDFVKRDIHPKAIKMCSRMEVEVVLTVVNNYIPGKELSLDIMDKSETLNEVCKELGRFCAKYVAISEMQQFVLPKPVYIDRSAEFFQGEDLQVYHMILEPIFKAACFKVYMEYLDLIDADESYVERANQNMKILLKDAIDICNRGVRGLEYPAYRPMITVRKAILALENFVNTVSLEHKDVVRPFYEGTEMSKMEALHLSSDGPTTGPAH